MRIHTDVAAYGGNCSLGEYGWDGWVGTYGTIDPKEKLILLYFVQRCDTGMNEVTRKIRHSVYSILL